MSPEHTPDISFFLLHPLEVAGVVNLKIYSAIYIPCFLPIIFLTDGIVVSVTVVDIMVSAGEHWINTPFLSNEVIHSTQPLQ